MDFKPPQTALACVVRRDEIQHPFLEKLFEWGKSLLTFKFGHDLGKHTLLIRKNEKEELDQKDTNLVIEKYLSAVNSQKGPQFKKQLIEDLKSVGFQVSKIEVAPLKGIRVNLPVEKIEGLHVTESDINITTEQFDISQGMFRALSLLTQITYSEYFGEHACILIDDIGEGLDYERSSNLIRLLIEKAKRSKVQLIMSTNDRFVMNNVSLEYQSIIKRNSKRAIISNIRNSKDKFDKFALTGLNNFDFFTGKFE